MRVFVAGGTGAIGRHLIPALISGGHQVTARQTMAAGSHHLGPLQMRQSPAPAAHSVLIDTPR